MSSMKKLAPVKMKMRFNGNGFLILWIPLALILGGGSCESQKQRMPVDGESAAKEKINLP